MKITIDNNNYQEAIEIASQVLNAYDDVQYDAWCLLLDCAQEAFLSE